MNDYTMENMNDYTITTQNVSASSLIITAKYYPDVIMTCAEPEPLKIVAAKPLCCKQCGAPLKIGDTGRYATCKYCQTIHSLESE